MDDSHGKEHRNRFILGMNYELSLKNSMLVGTGLFYAQKGFKESFLTLDNDYGVWKISETNDQNTYTYNYLTIPVKLGYSWGSKFIITPKWGVYASYLLKAETIRPLVDFDYKPTGDYETTNIKNYGSKFDFGGLLELECGYLIDNLILFSSVVYSHSFLPVNTLNVDYFAAERKIKHSVISWSLGMKVILR